MRLSPRMEAGLRCIDKAGVLSYYGLVAAAHTWELKDQRPTSSTMDALKRRGLVHETYVHVFDAQVVWVWSLTAKGAEVAKELGQ